MRCDTQIPAAVPLAQTRQAGFLVQASHRPKLAKASARQPLPARASLVLQCCVQPPCKGVSMPPRRGQSSRSEPAPIRVGIGGWTFAPWRGSFYPAALPHARELEYASRQLTSIEINGTFYRHQSEASFSAWADETPEDFVFSVKAHRATTHGRAADDAGPAVERFLNSGLAALGSKLGPILWQFPHNRKFDPALAGAFLAHLPEKLAGRPPASRHRSPPSLLRRPRLAQTLTGPKHRLRHRRLRQAVPASRPHRRLLLPSGCNAMRQLSPKATRAPLSMIGLR